MLNRQAKEAVMTRYTAPTLERHCNSWFILDLITGNPIFETFDRKTADYWSNQKHVEVMTAAKALARLNRKASL